MLQISVRTENNEVVEGVTAAELRAVLERVGGPDGHFVVAGRLPARADVFLQTSRKPGAGYSVEYRDGSPEQYACEIADAETVIGIFLAWARGEEGWRGGHDWQPLDVTATPGLDPRTRAEAEEFARPLVHGGFMSLSSIAREVTECVDTGERAPAPDEAAAIVGALWADRKREQETWPEVTDPDRVQAAFAELARQGLTARAHFSCCASCGRAEIRGTATEGDHGYVFFHYQDTRHAVAGHGLHLRYGTYDGSGEDAKAIGQAVAAALRAQDLPVEWDGSPDTTVQVTPLEWLKRLPA